MEAETYASNGAVYERYYILHNIEEESLLERNRLSRPNHSKKNSSMFSISDLFAIVKEYDKSSNNYGLGWQSLSYKTLG